MKQVKYKAVELTPREMQCGPGLACPAVYEVEEINEIRN